MCTRVSTHDICDDTHASGAVSARNEAHMSGTTCACETNRVGSIYDARASVAEPPVTLAVMLMRVGHSMLPVGN